MLIPENIIHNTLTACIGIVNEDFNRYSEDDTKTILYSFFGKDVYDNTLKTNHFNWYEQSKNLLLRDLGFNRRVNITMGYNQEHAGLPSIHILLPAETSYVRGIGMGSGYFEDKVYTYQGKEYVKNVFVDSFKATYSIMITSDNMNEVVLLYHFFRGMLIALFAHLELSGLRDPKFSGQDLHFDSSIAPPNIFHRNLALDFFYEVEIENIFEERIINFVNVEGIMRKKQ